MATTNKVELLDIPTSQIYLLHFQENETLSLFFLWLELLQRIMQIYGNSARWQQVFFQKRGVCVCWLSSGKRFLHTGQHLQNTVSDITNTFVSWFYLLLTINIFKCMGIITFVLDVWQRAITYWGMSVKNDCMKQNLTQWPDGFLTKCITKAPGVRKPIFPANRQTVVQFRFH